VETTVFLGARIPSRDDFHQEVLPPQTERGAIRGDFCAGPVEVVQCDDRKG
jgi:hypothetical protein